ncbi:hypothetical protein LF599_16530 [Pseudodesulfovibrio thermohalotolerans]|uniref:hypothetical protein n=1 Tax=Pseudodesulfovibrio thermohalotolerans TaxID=2880651 RepID=UPI0022B9DDBA|nr:hypothetical protein [Pseudodesulfovibrio thermohalotolerans]WFS62247.1 hypothetical protein LF599_16530 [Pseudodesulfovibrio thermohalotolerans]
MFEVVVETMGREYVSFTTEDVREAELIRQRHIRSLTDGTAYIRETKSANDKK